MKKRLFLFFIPLAILVAIAALNLFVPSFATLEQRVYDFFLQVKPPVAERNEILFMDVDDTAIEQVGQWPWSREYMARGLTVLREFDSGPVTFDIEYLEQSPLAVDVAYLQSRLPQLFNQEFDAVRNSIIDLFGAITAGQISLEDAQTYVGDLVFLTDDARDILLDATAQIAADNDALLGQAAAFHGGAYFTVNLPTDDELITGFTGSYDPTYAQSILPLQNVQIGSTIELAREAVDMWPALDIILQGSAGAGFPNVVVDDDGVRRRIDLIGRYQDQTYGQLVVAPLLDWLGNPEIIIRDEDITLRAARLPGMPEATDIEIPLTEDGRMLLNWPKETFINSFRHETYYRLVDYWEKEEILVEYLRAMDEAGLFFFAEGSENLIPLYDFAQSLQTDVNAGGDRSQIADWQDYRVTFFDLVGEILEGDAEGLYVQALNDALASGELDEEQITQYEYAREDAILFFGEARQVYRLFMENREVLSDVIPGSFIIIGWTGTSTTDIGVNPFIERYVNVGTHGALVNTILLQDFLDDLPWWIPFAVGGILSLLVTLILMLVSADPKKPRVLLQIIVGIGAAVIVFGGGLIYFLTTGVFANVITPVLAVLSTFVILTISSWISTTLKYARVNNLFGKYISPRVRDALIDDPDSQSMGGRQKELTAIFTDVKGFSTVSEKLGDPQRLGELLNAYLTGMSNKVLDEDGTIDKYEGDAIIAFFGAPVDLTDSPARACRAALNMHHLEEQLNRELVTRGLVPIDDDGNPMPLLTRIGINTGEMSVGNFGTEERRDYTMLGHHVNLAARLEGVNKQYGTWILVSENTYGKLNPREQERQFSWRRLDRIRAVGMSHPVRLFELVGFREEIDKDPDRIQLLKTFNHGVDVFEDRKWDEASALFKECMEIYPGDEPSKVYYKRCNDKAFLRRANQANWDGVFNLSEK